MGKPSMQIARHLTTQVCLWTKCAPITSGSASFIQKTLKDFAKSRKVSLARFRSKTSSGLAGKTVSIGGFIRYNPCIDEKGNVTRWYATGTDIEYRKQAEDKLRQDERELGQLIDFLPQHVAVLDKD